MIVLRLPAKLSTMVGAAALIFICCLTTSALEAQQKFLQNGVSLPVEKIMDTTFVSAYVRDSIKLDISLPRNYNEEKKSYPVIYMTDGYWRRAEHDTIHQMSDRSEIPDVIVVGIGYPDDYEFDSVRVRDLIKNAPSFLSCIRYEVIPLVEKNLRADTAVRTLWGASYGGHFLVYAFTEHQEQGGLFRNYIGASPALDPPYSHVDLFENERALWRSTNQLPVNLYLTVGGNETTFFRNSFEAIVHAISLHPYSGLRFEHEIIPEKNHFTVWEPTLLSGLKKFLK